MYVVESNISPFANIFQFEVDQGAAFVKLRKEMAVTGPVMYLGDSEADDPAFLLADISVGIKHRRVMPSLKCKYKLEFFELEVFLSKLIESNFNFQERMLQRNSPKLEPPPRTGRVQGFHSSTPRFLPSVTTLNRYRAELSLHAGGYEEYERDFTTKASGSLTSPPRYVRNRWRRELSRESFSRSPSPASTRFAMPANLQHSPS